MYKLVLFILDHRDISEPRQSDQMLAFHAEVLNLINHKHSEAWSNVYDLTSENTTLGLIADVVNGVDSSE